MAKVNRRSDHTGVSRVQFDKNKARLIKMGRSHGAVCPGCGMPIDFSVPYPEPMSATVDHIMPISKGGHPYAMENLQLMHFMCNRQKSNKLVTEKHKTMQKTEIRNDDLPWSLDWTHRT